MSSYAATELDAAQLCEHDVIGASDGFDAAPLRQQQFFICRLQHAIFGPSPTSTDATSGAAVKATSHNARSAAMRWRIATSVAVNAHAKLASMERTCVGRVAELPPGRMAEVTTGGRPYVICNVDGAFFGLDGTCPHRGAPLGEGALHGHTVVCPWHAWEFDCRTGIGDCGDVQTVRVTVDDDCIYLHA